MSSPAHKGANGTVMTNEDMLPLLRSLYASLHIEVLSLGVQICLCLYGYSVYRATSFELKRYRKPYCILSFVILVFAAISTVTDAIYLGQILISDPRDFVQAIIYDSGPWYSVLGTCATVMTNFIGDGLLIYRCYVIWPERRWVVIPPSVAFLASFSLSFVTVAAGHNNNINPAGVGAAWISLSVFINFYVTGTISWKLLSQRKRLSRVLGPAHLAKYVGASAILIESAFPFTIFGVIAAAFYANPLLSLTSGSSSVLAIWYCLAALCPQLIIFRVTTGSSFTSDLAADSEIVLEPIEFATNRGLPKPESPISEI